MVGSTGVSVGVVDSITVGIVEDDVEPGVAVPDVPVGEKVGIGVSIDSGNKNTDPTGMIVCPG
jgi:hypothetical protein